MSNALADLLSKAGGMAGNAVDKIGGRAYQLHLEEAKVTGEKPMTPEQFAKSQGKAG